MTLRRPLRFLVACTLGAACAPQQDSEAEHARYLEARRTVAGAAARSTDDRCLEEPACGEALAALAAIPPGSPDHAEATALVARVEAARRRPLPPPPPPPEATVEPEIAAEVAPLQAAAAVAPPPEDVAPAPGRKKNWKENPDDDDWGLTVVESDRPAAAPRTRRPREAEEEEEEPVAGPHPDPWRLPQKKEGRESCAELRAKIEARQIEIRNALNGIGSPFIQAPSGPHEAELSERERGDGTRAANFDDDSEVADLRRQLANCTEP